MFQESMTRKISERDEYEKTLNVETTRTCPKCRKENNHRLYYCFYCDAVMEPKQVTEEE